MAARGLTWVGILIVVVGAVDLVWTQVAYDTHGFDENLVALRWQLATGPLTVMAIGALVSVAAMILAAVHPQRPGSN